jgi:uncharacterized membrane protein
MTDPEVVHARDLSGDARVVHIMYLLHALSPFTAWLLAIVAIFVGFAKAPDVRGTYLESHVSWLSRTFWWGLLWIVLLSILTVILVLTVILIPLAWLLWTILFVWYLYRVIRGWLKLSSHLPI